jgi:hypothetical protein
VSKVVLEMETFTTMSCNEITMNLRTTVDVGVLVKAGHVCLDLSVAAIYIANFVDSEIKTIKMVFNC